MCGNMCRMDDTALHSFMGGYQQCTQFVNFHRDCRTLGIAMGRGLLVVAVKTMSLRI